MDDMLLGPDGQLRYLDVDLGFMKKHVLVPLDRAQLWVLVVLVLIAIAVGAWWMLGM